MAQAESLTAEANVRLNENWQALHRGEKASSVATRVADRLRWDKELSGAAITVVVVQGGLELRGKVRDAGQRKRATELAQSTLGVEKVVDTLEVAEKAP